MDFNLAFDRLVTSEGGYVNHPDDPGGETKFGISKRSYPHLNIAALTRDDAKAIYLRDFWLAGQMDKFDPGLAFQAFDAAVNHGIGNAIRFVQRAARVADDGYIGPLTVAAVLKISPTDMIFRFLAQRGRFWAKLSTYDKFGRGWMNRLCDDLDYAAEDT